MNSLPPPLHATITNPRHLTNLERNQSNKALISFRMSIKTAINNYHATISSKIHLHSFLVNLHNGTISFFSVRRIFPDLR